MGERVNHFKALKVHIFSWQSSFTKRTCLVAPIVPELKYIYCRKKIELPRHYRGHDDKEHQNSKRKNGHLIQDGKIWFCLSMPLPKDASHHHYANVRGSGIPIQNSLEATWCFRKYVAWKHASSLLEKTICYKDNLLPTNMKRHRFFSRMYSSTDPQDSTCPKSGFGPPSNAMVILPLGSRTGGNITATNMMTMGTKMPKVLRNCPSKEVFLIILSWRTIEHSATKKLQTWIKIHTHTHTPCRTLEGIHNIFTGNV